MQLNINLCSISLKFKFKTVENNIIIVQTLQ